MIVIRINPKYYKQYGQLDGELLEYLHKKYKAPYLTNVKPRSNNGGRGSRRMLSSNNPPSSDANRQNLIKAIKQYYNEYAPERVNQVMSIVDRYHGREKELIEYLELKYNGKVDYTISCVRNDEIATKPSSSLSCENILNFSTAKTF